MAVYIELTTDPFDARFAEKAKFATSVGAGLTSVRMQHRLEVTELPSDSHRFAPEVRVGRGSARQVIARERAASVAFRNALHLDMPRTGVGTAHLDSDTRQRVNHPLDFRRKNYISLRDLQRIVLDEFAPKSVVVNQEGQILCSSGGMENYLGISSGIFQNNIIKLAHSGLRIGLRSALGEAIKTSRTVVYNDVTVRTDKGLSRLKLTVQPMPQLGEQSGLYLVVFQDVETAAAGELDKTPGPADQTDALIEQLERELRTTREDLEKTIQDLEVANEELKSSNEELLSMNEELQSANEEMESSKEEIQAANDALARSNSDLENLLASTRIATLFLDEQHQDRKSVV